MAPHATAKRRHALGVRIIVRYGLIVIAVSMLLTSGIYASQRFEQFLIRDPRFFLPGPADYGFESSNLEVEGVRYASRAQILRIFDPDFGRSLFLFPLAARRKALLNVRWVHDASIVRIWPNRIQVRIRERQPVAFVKLQAESMARWALIDDEGVILDPPLKAAFHLPMLSGVQPSESAAQRGARVRRAERLMQDLGSLADKVSEVDVGDLDDLKVTEKLDGRAVTLMLGDHNFSARLGNFLDHYPDIHHRIPQVTTFDLRLDDRITGLGANDAR
jgi:cell division protein FtsQ